MRRIRPHDYALRPSSFALSVSIHAGLLALIWTGPLPYPPGESNRPKNLYELVIAPQQKKLVWYRRQDPLSPVVSEKPADGRARGRLQSFQQSIVATPPEPKPVRQMIWQPAPRLQLEKDLKAPNLIGIAAPVAPPPPRREPKQFTPPSSQPQNVAALPALPSPEISPAQMNIMPASGAVAGLPLAPKPKAKSFVPSPTGPARLPLPVPVLADAGEFVLVGGPAIGPVSAVGNGVSNALRVKPQPKTFTPISSGNGNGQAGSGGSGPVKSLINGDAPVLSGTGSSLNIAIVGLDPTDRLEGALPEGALPGQFSRAPVLGTPSGGGGTSGVRIPGLAVGGGAGNIPATAVDQPKASTSAIAANPVYLERVLPARPATLSAPLRPSARTIPRAVEARFQGRVVYTLVVPIPDSPGYGGDWVLWFAERDSEADAAPPMRAPMPVKKVEPVNHSRAAGEGSVENRLQLSAIIRKDGRLEAVSVVRGTAPGVDKLAMEDLQYWQFSPASRNGVMVDVDVVIEIPLRTDGRLARQ